MPVSTLSAPAKKLYEQVYNASKEAGDAVDVAAKKAWGALKQAGFKKNDKGIWVKSAIVESSMTITKVSFDPKSDTMRFRMVASDTGPDYMDERMSLELFNDFTLRIENNTPVPEPWKSILAEKSGWDGGKPYVSVSHFKSGVEGKNIPADTEKVYVDGECLKSTAICRNTPLGKAVFASLKADLEKKSKFEKPIRVSIGFLDLAHKHGDFVFERKGLASVCPMCENGVGDKTYLKGILVHNALTRVPANPRTLTEVEKSMDITTKLEDAESIVGEELATEIIKNKSALDDAADGLLVVKSEESVEEAPVVEIVEESVTEEVVVEEACDPTTDSKKKKKEEDAEDVPMKKSALDLAYDELKVKIEEFKSMPREDALKSVQPTFDAFASVIQNEFTEQKSTVITAEIDPALAGVLGDIKSMLEGFNAKMTNLSEEVTILKSQLDMTNKSSVQTTSTDTVRRNLQIERAITSASEIAGKPRSIKDIAKSSVFKEIAFVPVQRQL